MPTSQAPAGYVEADAPAALPKARTWDEEALAVDIVGSVKERQRELAGVEQQLQQLGQGFVWRRPGDRVEGRRGHRHVAQLTSLGKQQMELRNAIARDVKDLETLIDCTS